MADRPQNKSGDSAFSYVDLYNPLPNTTHNIRMINKKSHPAKLPDDLFLLFKLISSPSKAGSESMKYFDSIHPEE